MIEIKADTKNLRGVITKLKEHVSGLAIHKAVGLKMLRWVDENFRGQGGLVISGGWPDLSETTLHIRRTRKSAPTNSNLILRDHGDLRKSFDIFGMKPTARSVTVGTNDKRAALHQFGGQIRWGRNTVTIPARPILPDSQQAGEIIRPMLEAALKQAIKNARN